MPYISYRNLKLQYDLIDHIPGEDAVDTYHVYRDNQYLKNILPEDILSSDVFEHYFYDIRRDELFFEGRYKLIQT